VVDAVGEGLGRLLLIGPVPAGQTDGTGIEAQTDLALVALLTSGRVDEDDVEAGQRLAHRAVFELLVGRVADLQGRFGLAEAVADDHTPVALDTLDDLGIERVSRAPGLRRRGLEVTEIGLDEHAP